MNAVIIDSRGWALGLMLAQLNVCDDLLDDRSRVGTCFGIFRTYVLQLEQKVLPTDGH